MLYTQGSEPGITFGGNVNTQPQSLKIHLRPKSPKHPGQKIRDRCSECQATKRLGQRTQHCEYGLRCLLGGTLEPVLRFTKPKTRGRKTGASRLRECESRASSPKAGKKKTRRLASSKPRPGPQESWNWRTSRTSTCRYRKAEQADSQRVQSLPIMVLFSYHARLKPPAGFRDVGFWCTCGGPRLEQNLPTIAPA